MLPGLVVRHGEAVDALVGTFERMQRLQAEVDRSTAAIRDELANIRKLGDAVDELRARVSMGIPLLGHADLPQKGSVKNQPK
jgi:hypothetical protein